MFAVTTFPEWAWDIYARKCIESWVKVWPGSILAYFEGNAPPTQVPGVEFRPLDRIEARKEFLSRLVPKPISYLFDVKRFCHKVFSQLDAMDDLDQFWWIDADVFMRKPIPKETVDDITNQSFVSYLGRDTYTETGVIGFNTNDSGFIDFESRYRECYENHKIFELQYWTDCHAFDYARNGGGFNLTPDGSGVENVMRRSPLADYMEHHKGNLKFHMEEQ